MIVVTGAAGFIGSNLVYGLNKAGYDNLILVDDLNGAKERNIKGLKYQEIIGIEEFLEKHQDYKNLTAILHQGACADTTESRPDYILRQNTGYTFALFNHAQELEIPFIFASSAAVYGNGDNGFREEADCEAPLNLYGESKLLFDQFLRRAINRPEGLKSTATGFRYFNVYGPQENHKGRMASVPFHLFNQAKENARLKIFEGSDGFKRDFISVEDIVKVNLHFLENPHTGIFNVGTGQARSFKEMAEVISNELPGTEIEFIPFPDDLKGKYQEFTEADLSHLREAGYAQEFMTLESGLKDYLRLFESSGGYLF